jgi:hypothetical protein
MMMWCDTWPSNPASMQARDSFIPAVSFASYAEYEIMLESLIQEYQQMVLGAVTPRRVVGWCGYYEELSMGVIGHWREHGANLFLKLTKGNGHAWCETMNTMVVHALNTALRVLIYSHKQAGEPMTGRGDNDRKKIASLLEREVRLAIREPGRDPNNMDAFLDRNFQYAWADDDQLYGDYIPTIADVQDTT